MHLTILLGRLEIFQVQNHLWKSRQLMVRSGPSRQAARSAFGLVEGTIIRRRARPEKREFLLTKARSEELRAAEADAWRKPASATEPSSSAKSSGSAREEGAQPEPVDEQPLSQPDVGDSEMAAGTETPDAEATRRTRT